MGTTETAKSLPLDQVKQIGEADLARNLAALREACEAYAPDATVKECVDRMNADKPLGGPVEAARGQLEDLRAFVVANDLVTIPGEERVKVAEAPPYRRFNFAYIEIPGPYEKNLPSVYYIAPADQPRASPTPTIISSAPAIRLPSIVCTLAPNRPRWSMSNAAST
jgi:hypothetical protein